MKMLFHVFKLVLLIGIIFKSSIATAQLTIDDGHYQIDKNLRLILCNAIPDKIPVGTTSISIGETYTLPNPITNIQVGKAYAVTRNDTTYQLYFTHLPIITINAINPLSDQETSGSITIHDTVGTLFSSSIGIKTRGSYSSTFPKKSYHIQLWTDSTGRSTKDESLLGMRSDHTWLLLAMYNEKLRLNNKVSHELWLKMHKLYYADLEPDAHATIRTRYVEIFVNKAYQGVYLFAENMDRKELKLKKQTTAGTGGELYKGTSWDAGTLFAGVPNLPAKPTALWGGWELDYPDSSQTNWSALHNFTDFIVNASDSTFSQQVSAKIREDNFVDYFIFLNLLRAEDNQGKNLFLARYNETAPYFIAPWDLDGAWGYYWNGDQRNMTNDILSNNLFNRLLSTNESFKSQLAKRWFSL
ncbi:CotH kinase family protein [Spirosoma validum]|uniref:CotH kinase family protein n=1 Tax=Spirosoma validum TaxID=2771355 RepID=A0A927GGI9_9BACT|nr:CotH kinase family protein [Spirosoma validum]MBD2756926.1 CotH kinase family protein [Spirosoma validum]